MQFDRFDICAAYHMYSVLYSGDGEHYANGIQCRLSRIKYRPSRSEEYVRGLSENAKSIFGALVRRAEPTLVEYERLTKRANGRLTDAEIRRAVGLPAPRYGY